MTREEAVRALETGIELAEWCAAQGYRLVCGAKWASATLPRAQR